MEAGMVKKLWGLILCFFGWHKWVYGGGIPPAKPFRICLRCSKTEH